MKTSARTRLLTSVAMALIFGAVSFFIVQAQPDEQPALQQGDDCYRCHQELYGTWHASPHGKALEDEIFQERWQEQDQPAECLSCHTTGYDPQTGTWTSDGITCSNCHKPIPDDHPNSPMPVDQSSALCETCHLDNVYEWKTSDHRLAGLRCVDCHSQHTATLKAADAGLLCATCHHDIPMTFAHTRHSDQNLSCPDCHVEYLPGAAVEERGYAAKDHDFSPKVTACDNCHEYRSEEIEADPSNTFSLGIDYHDMLDDVAVQGLDIEPDPVNPITFAVVSAIIGMVAGLLLSPWIQTQYARFDFQIEAADISEEE